MSGYPPPWGAGASAPGGQYPPVASHPAYPNVGSGQNPPPGQYPPAGGQYPPPGAPSPASHPGAAPAGYPGAAPAGYPGASAASHGAVPMHPSAAAGPMVAVVGSSYCMPHEVVLKVEESIYGLSGDDFKIMDAQTGALWYKIEASVVSMRGSRVLLDARGQPVLGLRQRTAMSLRMAGATWQIFKGKDFTQRICDVTPKTKLTSKYVNVYLNDGDKEPDFFCTGNFLAKKFEVFQTVPGKQPRKIADFKKESRFSSAQAYLIASQTSADAFYITIQPNVDTAFISALCVVIDELYHDAQQ